MAFSIGIDYGTESGRVLLLDLITGAEVATSVIPYRNGVISTSLPGQSVQLPPDWALQDPRDYVDVILKGIPSVLKSSDADPTQVVGIGVAFTSCTVMPVKKDRTPLCELPEWEMHPHAWPKLWKHHSAQPVADRINAIALERGEAFLQRYGGRISSEWYFPKLLEIFEQDRSVYDACDYFIEAEDWIVWVLCGRLMRSLPAAGFKAMWSDEDGLPSEEFFKQVNKEFTIPDAKLGSDFYIPGTKAGTLRSELAASIGLLNTVAVSVGNIDAHTSVPGAGVYSADTMVMAIGTSICHLTTTRREVRLPGITGVVKDGVLPGLYGYEAGQAAVGDMFAWFVRNCVSSVYEEGAQKQGLTVYEYLERIASNLKAGQSGLVVLDWFNGNRSTLGDASLSGTILGLTLQTKPEDIYLSLFESVAFGTRKIIDNFRESGIGVNDLVACGGVARRSSLLMQIYADVCQVPVIVPASEEVVARGAALFGAVAAGTGQQGFATIAEAARTLKPPVQRVYQPNSTTVPVYQKLYAAYSELYGLLGDKHGHIMHSLKKIRFEQSSDKGVTCSPTDLAFPMKR